MATSDARAIGSVWEIDAKKGPVVVTRPDGESVTVAPDGGTARYVLGSEGTYRAETPDGKTVEVTAK